MKKKSKLVDIKRFQHIDKVLLWTMIGLVLAGFYAIYSASIYTAFYAGDSVTKYLFVQAMGVFLGGSIYISCIFLPYKFYLRGTIIFIALIICLGLLIFVLTTPAVLGASRWITLGPFRFQPAEPMKIVYIIFLAYWFTKCEGYCYADGTKILKGLRLKGKKRQIFWQNNQGIISRFGILIGIPLIVTSIFAILLLLQPDNGSIIIMIIVFAVMATIVFIRKKFILTLLAILIALVLVALWAKDDIAALVIDKVGADSHIAVRFRAWLDPFADYEGDGYQISNSYIAIAKGGVAGVGNGNGSQKQGFLPEIHTDFILANISEEHGLIGISFILLMFLGMINQLISIAIRIENKQAKLTLIGIATLIFIQVFWNAGGISGLLPMKGLTSPFLSYGGTSVMFMIATLGIAQGIIAQENLELSYSKEEYTVQLNKQNCEKHENIHVNERNAW